MLDLDGTLLDRDETVSERVAAAIHRVSCRIPVAIASGREPADVARFARELGLRTPQVSDNGARIIDPLTEETLEEHPLEAADARRILEMLAGRGLRFFAVDSGRIVRKISEVRDWQVTVIAGHTLTAELTGDVMATEADSSGVTAIPSRDGDGVKWYVNFTRAGTDKGSGVRRWAERTGAAMPGVVFIGDSYNDLSAFAAVGMPVAMGSAPDDVKEAARHVVPDVYHDGVAEAVDRLVFPYLAG